MCEKESSKCSLLFFGSLPCLNSPNWQKPMAGYTAQSLTSFSGMLDHPSNISIMVLQKQPIQEVPHMMFHRAAYKLVLGFCMPGAPIPFRHILIAYALAFSGTTDVCRFPFPLSRTAVEERSSALGGWEKEKYPTCALHVTAGLLSAQAEHQPVKYFY